MTLVHGCGGARHVRLPPQQGGQAAGDPKPAQAQAQALIACSIQGGFQS